MQAGNSRLALVEISYAGFLRIWLMRWGWLSGGGRPVGEGVSGSLNGGDGSCLASLMLDVRYGTPLPLSRKSRLIWEIKDLSLCWTLGMS